MKKITASSPRTAVCVLALLIAGGAAACGQAPRQPVQPQTQQHPSTQQSCTRGGHDSCYLLDPSGQQTSTPQTCASGGHDSCYLLAPSK